ncbi:MAG TPA: hypothetical protein VF794_00650, partial [Archangium sp.]|uniref:hypothetical protein n=1 Tax=Archangium sp. TaxID=1872627 RepID=UPI002EDA0EC2
RRIPGGIAFNSTGDLIVTPSLNSYGVNELQLFRLASTTWEPHTGPQTGAMPGTSDLAIDSLDNWFVTYPARWETGTDFWWAIHVNKKDIYGTWTRLGDPLISPAQGRANSASLALNGNSRPIVTWEEFNSSDSNIYAAIWNGLSWQMLGGTINDTTTSNTRPALVMGHDGQPIVAWSGYSAPETAIWVSRWNGSDWQQLGSRLSAASGVATSSFRPALALDKNSQPLVAWHESDGTVSNIYVYRYNY